MNDSPRSFGKYLLDREIARGGMSRVFLARLRGLGGFEKRLVVKQVLPELASDPRFVSMFVDEAKTVVGMSHPHIAPVYELGVIDGIYFLAMEYVEGATLAELLKAGPLAPELAAHIGAEICEALHYAHSRFAIVHRDVTPRNVIVDEEGHTRLLDFGIAAPSEGAQDAPLFGTPGYISPEQARGDSLGPASDTFALGAVLYEALVGYRAFPANSLEAVKRELAAGPPPLNALPAALKPLVARALRTDPATRFSSARELGRALRTWLAESAPGGVGPELAERVREAQRTRRPPPADEAPRPSRRENSEIRTLATSELMDALLTAEVRPTSSPDAEVTVDEEEETTGVTLALTRSSAPAANQVESEPATARIEDEKPPLRREPVAVAPDDGAPAASESASRLDHGEAVNAAPRLHHRRSAMVATALVAGLAIAGFVAWGGATPSDPTVHPSPPVARPSAEPHTTLTPAVAPPPSPETAAAPVTDLPSPPPRERPPIAAPRGRVSVNTLRGWGQVLVDGRTVGNTPIRDLALPAGEHSLVVRNELLGKEARARFELRPRERVRAVANLNADPPTISVR